MKAQASASSRVLDQYTHRTLDQDPPVGRAQPPAEVAGMHVLCRDRLGGLIHEYAQVAWGDAVSGTHTVQP